MKKAGMKFRATLIFALVISITFLLLCCSTALEKDARKLALLQKQKREKVGELLRCQDPKTRMALQSDFQILETKYDKLKQECEIMYADSSEKQKFDIAFREELKK